MPNFWDSSLRLDLLLSEAIGEMKMAEERKKTSNLLRLAGVINSANREADDEAGALIERVRKNRRRTLDLITKGHENESMRERMLSEAEKEQALADLAAAVGDNGAPLDDEESDEEARQALQDAKKSSAGSEQRQEPKTESSATGRSPEVDPAATFPGEVQGVREG